MTATRPIDRLNIHHVAALMRWQAEQGRFWKRALLRCWETGNYGALTSADVALLQQVRNVIGPSGLQRLSLR